MTLHVIFVTIWWYVWALFFHPNNFLKNLRASRIFVSHLTSIEQKNRTQHQRFRCCFKEVACPSVVFQTLWEPEKVVIQFSSSWKETLFDEVPSFEWNTDASVDGFLIFFEFRVHHPKITIFSLFCHSSVRLAAVFKSIHLHFCARNAACTKMTDVVPLVRKFPG